VNGTLCAFEISVQQANSAHGEATSDASTQATKPPPVSASLGAERAPRRGPEVRSGLAHTSLIWLSGFGVAWFATQLLSPILDGLLVGFAGLLLSLFLSGIGEWLAKHVSVISPRWATASCVVVFVAAMSLSLWLAAPSLSAQFGELGEQLPEATRHAIVSLRGVPLLGAVFERADAVGDAVLSPSGLSRAKGMLSSTLGALTSAFVVLVVGLYIAFDPQLYARGILRALPTESRDRAERVMGAVAHALRLWMVGKVFSMTLVFVLTWLGLQLLGVSLPLTLALLAAALTFIPNFGPILAAIPPVLLALMESPSAALNVVLLYVGVQFVESYLITPLIQQRTSDLPPALTIFAQLLMAVVAGGIGVVVATPLTVALLALFNELRPADAANGAA